MGKKARKLRSPKYAAKAAAFRENVAKLNAKRVIQIDMNTGEEVEDDIIVVKNKEPDIETTKSETIEEPSVELQLETVQIEEPKIPNALKHIEEKPKSPRRKAPAKKRKTKSRVNEAANYTKPTMRKRLFNKIKAGSKGGAPGQWSARKAQMLAKQYKAAGGGYR